jgi:hypothetical protein
MASHSNGVYTGLGYIFEDRGEILDVKGEWPLAISLTASCRRPTSRIQGSPPTIHLTSPNSLTDLERTGCLAHTHSLTPTPIQYPLSQSLPSGFYLEVKRLGFLSERSSP